MNKINGYTEEEAKSLVEYIWAGKQSGKTLTYLFESYGARHGRAKGSVRNYYYALMRSRSSDERVGKLLDGKRLNVEKIREFTEEETDEALRNILTERSKGISVRRAIANIAQGDDKLMLRLQNKYRNVLKKQPERIDAMAIELGVEGKMTDRSFLKRPSTSRTPSGRCPSFAGFGRTSLLVLKKRSIFSLRRITFVTF